MSFECWFAAMTAGRFKRNGVKDEFFTTVGYKKRWMVCDAQRNTTHTPGIGGYFMASSFLMAAYLVGDDIFDR